MADEAGQEGDRADRPGRRDCAGAPKARSVTRPRARSARSSGATARRMRDMNESHWAEAWVGRPYVEGEHDCADFVVAVLRERFGRTLALPAHAASCSRAPSGATVRAWDRQIAALKGTFAVPTIAPQEGDGVLMRSAARRRSVGHHIGLWCVVAGEPYVLHCLRGVGSIFHPIRDLGQRALALEGVYRWFPPSCSEAGALKARGSTRGRR